MSNGKEKREQASEIGMRLVQSGKRGLKTAIFSRLGIITLLLLVQILLLLSFFYWLDGMSHYYTGLSAILVAVMGLRLINSESDPTAKITWLVIIAVLPVFGCLLYFFTQQEIGHRILRTRMSAMLNKTADSVKQDEAAFEALKQRNPRAASLAAYVSRSGCHRVFTGTDVRYCKLGEVFLEELLRDLERAQRFIFLEYFIIGEGEMWGRILEVLARKAAAGVEVRVLYDGTNEYSNLPHDYTRRLEKLGIAARIFAPVAPFISTHYNYRDHRKIAVIDGQVAYTGGLNLADEYINAIEKYGHWKDTAIRLDGSAAQGFTLLFLQMWGSSDRELDIQRFLQPPKPVSGAKGFVLPYGDSPLDEFKTGEQVYIDMLYRAERYIHIMSPYLILDSNMETALQYAAQRGVEVKLMLPGIPDKWPAHSLAQGHYAALVKAGVEVYEYSPGYLHAKQFVVDDCEAVVGTINLDYRSLYHHFECAAWLYDVPCIADVEQDFQQTLELCRRMTPQAIASRRWTIRVLGKIMKIFAPLM